MFQALHAYKQIEDIHIYYYVWQIQPMICTDRSVHIQFLPYNKINTLLSGRQVVHGNKNNHRFPPEAGVNYYKHKLQGVIKLIFIYPEGIFQYNIYIYTNKWKNLLSKDSWTILNDFKTKIDIKIIIQIITKHVNQFNSNSACTTFVNMAYTKYWHLCTALGRPSERVRWKHRNYAKFLGQIMR